MKIFLVTMGLLLTGSLVFGQKKDFHRLIPTGYDTLYEGVARGDLNKDGIEDVALALFNVLEKDEQWKEKHRDSTPPRMLLILFGDANGFKKAAQTFSALMCSWCGGAFGDPFQGIGISGNVLEIYHYGGSSWKWSVTHKFRYQKNDWYLIGRTKTSFLSVGECDKLDDFPGTDYEDINFLTGDYEKRKVSEDCRILENKKGKRKPKPLVSLSKFNIE